MTKHFGYTKKSSNSSSGGGGGSGSTLPCPPDHPRTGLLSAPQNLLHQTIRRSALNPPTHTKTRGTHAAPSRRAGNRLRRGNTFRGGTDVTSARASPRRATPRKRGRSQHQERRSPRRGDSQPTGVRREAPARAHEGAAPAARGARPTTGRRTRRGASETNQSTLRCVCGGRAGKHSAGFRQNGER